MERMLLRMVVHVLIEVHTAHAKSSLPSVTDSRVDVS
jgi:hypothetical protein